MAIYHLVVRPVSRNKGQSVIHKAAYNARTKLCEESTGKKTKNYRNESPLLFEKIFAPEGAPAWVFDRNELWNHVERAEKRKDARVAREVEIALPYELTNSQREDLLSAFILKAFVSEGMVADTVIHASTRQGDVRNCHAHILLTTRAVNHEGLSKTKNRGWNHVDVLFGWRELWCFLCNGFLERYGHEARISHRSLKALGVDRIPTKHVGPHISRMEKRGMRTRRGDYLREKKTNPEYLTK